MAAKTPPPCNKKEVGETKKSFSQKFVTKKVRNESYKNEKPGLVRGGV